MERPSDTESARQTARAREFFVLPAFPSRRNDVSIASLVPPVPSRSREFAMLMSLLLAASAASAPPQQARGASTASEPIVVEGRPTKETANDYVDKLLPAMGTEAQFGRFEDPLCPKTIGLSDDLATQVADRIRQVAKATNLQVAAGNCTPNLLIIAAADKKAM